MGVVRNLYNNLCNVTTMNISIRPEDTADIDDIYELNTMVFGQDNEARLVDHIRHGPNFIPQLSLVAFSDEKLIGYILFSKVVVANGDFRHESLGVTSMVVHPEFQKKRHWRQIAYYWFTAGNGTWLYRCICFWP